MVPATSKVEARSVMVTRVKSDSNTYRHNRTNNTHFTYDPTLQYAAQLLQVGQP
jgi:hypothetical protein